MNQERRVLFDLNQALESEDSVHDSQNGGEERVHLESKSGLFDLNDTNNDDRSSKGEKVSRPYFQSKLGLVMWKCKGVRLARSGKRCVNIWKSIEKRQVYVGSSYIHAEAASDAYQMKRKEFDALAKSVNFSSEKSIEKCSVVQVCKSNEENGNRRSGRAQCKRVWSGTVNTAEEASNAYRLKRIKFGARTELIDVPVYASPAYQLEMRKMEMELGGLNDSKGAQLEAGGKWAAQIKDPIKRKKVWSGTYNTAQEASNALTKSVDFSSEKLSKPKACSSSKSSEYAFMVTSRRSRKSSKNVVPRFEKPDVILSNNSRDSMFSLTSYTPLSSDNKKVSHPFVERRPRVITGKHLGTFLQKSGKWGADASSASFVAANANEPKKVDENLIAIASDTEAEMETDFAKALKGIPLFVDDTITNYELPDFDLDIESEDWTDDEPIL